MSASKMRFHANCPSTVATLVGNAKVPLNLHIIAVFLELLAVAAAFRHEEGPAELPPRAPLSMLVRHGPPPEFTSLEPAALPEAPGSGCRAPAPPRAQG